MKKLTANTELPPPLELECLKVLWRLGPANVKDVREALEPNRELAYTTVMTILERLVRRGCVSRIKSGRSFVYSATLTRDCVQRQAIRDLVEAFFEGSEDSLRHYLGAGSNGVVAAAVAVGNDAGSIDSRLEAALL